MHNAVLRIATRTFLVFCRERSGDVPLTLHHTAYGSPHNDDVVANGCMALVDQIKRRFTGDAEGGVDFFGFSRGLRAGDKVFFMSMKMQGRQTCNSGAGGENFCVKLWKGVGILAQRRAGADEAHVAAQDV